MYLDIYQKEIPIDENLDQNSSNKIIDNLMEDDNSIKNMRKL